MHKISMPTRPDPRTTALLLTLTLILGILLATITVMNRLGADRWWLGALNLYLPQAIWSVPGILLALALFMVNRRWTWAPLLCVAWVFGPVMGLCWPLKTSPEPADIKLRVMTCNMKFGQHDISALFADIEKHHPDVILLQDATRLFETSYREFFRSWQVRHYGQFVIASRLPLEDAKIEGRNFPGLADNQFFLRCRLRIAGTEVTVYNVHFQSPREALSEVWWGVNRPRFYGYASNQLGNNAKTRLTQANSIRNHILQEQGPIIVAGDFNSPDVSLVCATLRSAGLRDAFAEGGKGYGYTYGHFLLSRRFPLLRFSFIRIDHIMMSSPFQTVRSWTGTAAASDHRPVFADLVLQPHSRNKKQ